MTFQSILTLMICATTGGGGGGGYRCLFSTSPAAAVAVAAKQCTRVRCGAVRFISTKKATGERRMHRHRHRHRREAGSSLLSRLLRPPGTPP